MHSTPDEVPFSLPSITSMSVLIVLCPMPIVIRFFPAANGLVSLCQVGYDTRRSNERARNMPETGRASSLLYKPANSKEAL